MIERIIIQNFQSHKKTVIKPEKGVNVFVGLSDSGKSSIFRALFWLLTNKPSGEAFKSHWGGETLVEILFDDGIAVGRVKGKENIYYIETEDSVQEFKAMKQSEVPEEVLAVLNMNDLNMQSQFDPHFLISSSAGEVAKILNRVVQLTDIDVALGNVKKLVSETNKEIYSTEQHIKTLDEQLKLFVGLAEREKDVKAYERLEERQKQNTEQIETLEGLLQQIEGKESKLKEITSFCSCEQEVNKINKHVGVFKNVETKAEQLFKTIKQIEDIEIEIRSLNMVDVMEREVSSILMLNDRVQPILRKVTDLNKMISRIEDYEDLILHSDKTINSKEKEVKEYMKGKCPLCGK